MGYLDIVLCRQSWLQINGKMASFWFQIRGVGLELIPVSWESACGRLKAGWTYWHTAATDWVHKTKQETNRMLVRAVRIELVIKYSSTRPMSEVAINYRVVQNKLTSAPHLSL